MKRIGTDAAGFSVVFDAEVGAVRVRAWGFWTTDVCENFAPTVSDICRANPGAGLLMDMTELKPLRDEGQQSFGKLVEGLRELGVGRTAVAIASHLTKLQLLRLVAERGGQHSVQFANADTELSREIVTKTTPEERIKR